MMKICKFCQPRFAHISLQYRLGCLEQIHQDQSIQDIIKVRVTVKTQELAPQFQILFEQDGNSLLF